jgi:hypothetical protein
MKLFYEEIFEELLMIICELWEKYITFKETTKLCEELSKFLAPSATEIEMNQCLT